MAYIIGIILVVIALIIIGLIFRKRVYDDVDRRENWKMDIVERDVAAQLTQIKKLNLSGETQEKFESWKSRWEHIVTKDLANVEEILFDVETAADRYRFRAAKKNLKKSAEKLQAVEADIEMILSELNELLESEKTGREKVETLQPQIREMRRKLSQNRYQYGKAEGILDKRIDELDAAFAAYNDLADAGDYLEAKQLVDQLKQEIESLRMLIDTFPALYRKCRHDLPAQLGELLTGIRGMKDDGYRIEHLAFEREIHSFQSRLIDCVASLDKAETETVEPLIQEVEERIAEMYRQLEREAIAKSYIEAKIPGYRSSLAEVSSSFEDTKDEVEAMKSAYYFEDSDMERYLMLEKTITQLNSELEEIAGAMEADNTTAHSALREQLDEGFRKIDELEENHEDFKKRIHNLRKDEIEAKETLEEIREQIFETGRKLKKSNIPGVPNFIWNMMENASGKNNDVFKALDKQPLEITEVQYALTEAKAAVGQVVEQTDLLLEQAALTEQVIQYANRYRSKHPQLAANLAEAEHLFRSYEYELALEKAAAAVEQIEPGALKRIEHQQK